jgi:chemotaxis protein CheD
MTLNGLLTAHQLTMAIERTSADAPSSQLPAANERPRPNVYVHAGQLFASPVGTDVTTILGSCVAICLWDTVAGIGGMNHYMLSFDRGAASMSLRQGNYATEELLLALSRFGAVRGRLRAKIFGGACILQSFQQGGSDLGQKNVELARALLEGERISIVGEDVGGPRGRKLIFSTDSGEALVKRL